MVPAFPFQLDYQDFCLLVEEHLHLIKKYEEKNNIKFNGVVAKFRNGSIPGAIISNELRLYMGAVSLPRAANQVDFLQLPHNYEKGKAYNLLLVDAICTTGEALKTITAYIQENYPEINVVSYSTIVARNSIYKPDIMGIVEDRFIQPPWEYNNFTPTSHLERLYAMDSRAIVSESFHFLCASKFVFEQLEYILKMQIDIAELSDNITFTINKKEHDIDWLINFIKKNGVTHYFDTDEKRALDISLQCPVIKVYLLVNDIRYGSNNFTQKIIKINSREEPIPYISNILKRI